MWWVSMFVDEFMSHLNLRILSDSEESSCPCNEPNKSSANLPFLRTSKIFFNHDFIDPSKFNEFQNNPKSSNICVLRIQNEA